MSANITKQNFNSLSPLRKFLPKSVRLIFSSADGGLAMTDKLQDLMQLHNMQVQEFIIIFKVFSTL